MRGGWFHSGDLARRDEDGYYFIVDRKKDMIIRGGYNVYPREVEEILYAHPAVAEAAVFGVPDARMYGEEVAALVTPQGRRFGDRWRVARLCEGPDSRRYKYPRIVRFGPIPKGPTGKILKRRSSSSRERFAPASTRRARRRRGSPGWL